MSTKLRENKLLNNIRHQIDMTDNLITELLKKRFDSVKKLGKLKKQNGIKITDKKREKNVIKNVIKNAGSYKKEMEEVFKKVIILSRRIQR
jgi:chorismate mutase